MKNQAFTLIELLVVVLIIGILAAIAVPQYQLAVAKSRFATLKELTKSIQQAQELYYLAHDTYATKFEELDIVMPGGVLNTDVGRDNRLDQYNYDWGYCYITSALAGCQNGNYGIIYQVYYDKTTQPGRKVCNVQPPTNEIGNKICQLETGRSEPDKFSDTYTSYGYQ